MFAILLTLDELHCLVEEADIESWSVPLAQPWPERQILVTALEESPMSLIRRSEITQCIVISRLCSCADTHFDSRYVSGHVTSWNSLTMCI